jgi:hypothetical protein
LIVWLSQSVIPASPAEPPPRKLTAALSNMTSVAS